MSDEEFSKSDHDSTPAQKPKPIVRTKYTFLGLIVGISDGVLNYAVLFLFLLILPGFIFFKPEYKFATTIVVWLSVIHSLINLLLGILMMISGNGSLLSKPDDKEMFVNNSNGILSGLGSFFNGLVGLWRILLLLIILGVFSLFG